MDIPRTRWGQQAPKGKQPPRPTISAEADRLDRLDNDQFEKRAVDLAQATAARPALITAAEIDKVRTGYGTGSGRLEVLTRVTNARHSYWLEQAGEAPLDRLSEGDRAKAAAFFKEHGVGLAGATREAPPNPIRTAPAVATGAAAPEPKPAPAAVAAPDLTAALALLTRIAKAGEAQATAMAALATAMNALGERLAKAPTGPAASSDSPPKCKYHGGLMKESKKPGVFFCPKKMADGAYCDYKVGGD